MKTKKLMDKIHALERSTNDLKIIRHKQNNLEKNQLHYYILKLEKNVLNLLEHQP